MRRIMLLLTMVVVMAGVMAASAIPAGAQAAGPGEDEEMPPQPRPPQFPPPTVIIHTPADGAVFTQGQQIAADYECIPSVPQQAFNLPCVGIHLRPGDVQIDDGELLPTDILGTHEFQVVSDYEPANPGAPPVVVKHTYEVVPACPQPTDGAQPKGGGELPATGGITPLAGGGVAAASVLILGAATMLVGRRIRRR